jgi:membrane fusion protein (multidrug efflux system)
MEDQDGKPELKKITPSAEERKAQEEQQKKEEQQGDLKAIAQRGFVIVWQDKTAGEDAEKQGGDAKGKEGGGEKKDEKKGDGEKGEGSKPDKEGEKKKGFHWTPLKVALLVGGLLLILVVGVLFYIHESHYESTDDAYLAAYVHQISSRVNSTVIEVAVDDNQSVKRGQVLVRLDPRDFQVQVDKAQADYDRAIADFNRIRALRDDIAISKQDYDQSDTSVQTAKANLEDAKNQLSYCTITAPTDGTVGNKSVQTGNRVTVGGALMSVVQSIWVVANFKETQVGAMRVGQKATIQVDEVADHTFTGTIDSFSPGTGSTFALLPPDNATGNFTKIVQRVPVKILFDPDSLRNYEERLVPGLSCEPTVDLTSEPQDKDTPEKREHNEPDRDGREHRAPPPDAPAHG